MKQLALTHDLPVLQPQRLRAKHLADIEADVLVVVAYGQILRPEVLGYPKHGGINVHASLLPRWRGAAPIQRAILAGDKQTGVCIMQMDEGLDTGDILCRREVEISEDDTTGSLTEKLAEAGCVALAQTLDALEAGDLSPEPQPEAGVTWADKIDKHEARLLWEKDAVELSRAVRAFNPEPGAWALIDGMRVKIWQALAVPGQVAVTPGQILSFGRSGIEVACGKGRLLLTRVQLPIGKGSVVTAADLLNARRDEFTPGHHFE